jgi:hypothetical protein
MQAGQGGACDLLHERCTCSGAIEKEFDKNKNNVFGERHVGVLAAVCCYGKQLCKITVDID